MEEFVEWITNGQPPWAANRAFMSGQLIALGKHPGVRLVGVGETWSCLMTKCVLQVMGQEAKASCGTDQLSGGVEAGIEGGDTQYAPPLVTALTGVGLGVSPH